MSLLKNDIKERLSIVILCAGEGTRLQKISTFIPKPLIKIERLNGISILHNTINNLLNFKLNKIGIVIGHLGDIIREFITTLKKNNPTLKDKLIIIDSVNQYKLGPLYSILSITKNKYFFNKNNYFLIFPGDTIFDYSILKEIFNIIFDNFALIHKYPFTFYRKIGLKPLKELYKKKKLISNAEIQIVGSEITLKRISQKKVGDFGSKEVVNQIIPIFAVSYDFINDILNLKHQIPTKTLWETLNYEISNRRKILCFKLENEHNFYDIDNEYDLKIQKKKRKGQ